MVYHTTKKGYADEIDLIQRFLEERYGDTMVAERIKELREQEKMTQTELSKRLGITRSAVNAWEMGISVPSTQYILELAELFRVSTDYLLGARHTSSVSVEGLDDEDIRMICLMIAHLRRKNGSS